MHARKYFARIGCAVRLRSLRADLLRNHAGDAAARLRNVTNVRVRAFVLRAYSGQSKKQPTHRPQLARTLTHTHLIYAGRNAALGSISIPCIRGSVVRCYFIRREQQVERAANPIAFI